MSINYNLNGRQGLSVFIELAGRGIFKRRPIATSAMEISAFGKMPGVQAALNFSQIV